MGIYIVYLNLSHKSGGGARLILPVRGQHALGFVVACEPVDSRLYENEPEFAVFVFPVTFQVLPHSDGFLDQVVQVFR